VLDTDSFNSPARRRTALVGAYVAGVHGALRPEGPQITFTERSRLTIVQVESDAEASDAVATRLRESFAQDPPLAGNTASGSDQARLIWVGPGRWLAVTPKRDDLEAELGDALAGTGAAVVDLSHGRSVLRMGGHEARYVLAKGSGLNVHPRRFHAGCAAQTALFHIDVLVDCTDDAPSFDLYVARSLALSLWQSLRLAAAEYGYRIV
jgi:heterotetrameric sarcosine oxidase gamma subunit